MDTPAAPGTAIHPEASASRQLRYRLARPAVLSGEPSDGRTVKIALAKILMIAD